MTDWETHSPQMDDDIDSRLGDTISLSLDAGATFSDIVGYILLVVVSSGIDGFDETLGYRPRAKIRKTIIGADPPDRSVVRLRSAKLGDFTYQPAGGEPDDQGRYWLFDIQKIGINPEPFRFSNTQVDFSGTDVSFDSDDGH